MLTEDPALYLADFGVTVTSGAISGKGIIDMPSQVIVNGVALTTEYSVVVLTSQFGNLLYGSPITVDGVAYSVREPILIADGIFTELCLTKLAPGVVAPGSQPRDFSLDDLSDVTITNPTAGEVLKYTGSQWVDAADEGGGYVFTQAAPAGTWTINHNLGHVPSVEVFDSGSNEVDADVTHPSTNTTVIMFTIPIAGFARLT